MSQRELAARCGIGEKQIWRYENGESEPTSGQLIKICRELFVSSDYLLGLVDHLDTHFTGDELTATEHKILTLLRQADTCSTLSAIQFIAALERRRLNEGKSQADTVREKLRAIRPKGLSCNSAVILEKSMHPKNR